MQTKTDQVCAALRECMAWYDAAGEAIRQVSERTEELWFQMDDFVLALQDAENREDTVAVERLIQNLLYCALAIEAEVYFVRSNRW